MEKGNKTPTAEPFENQGCLQLSLKIENVSGCPYVVHMVSCMGSVFSKAPHGVSLVSHDLALQHVASLVPSTLDQAFGVRVSECLLHAPH